MSTEKSKRQLMVAELIRKKLSEVIEKKFVFERLSTHVDVTFVDIAKDLKNAKAFLYIASFDDKICKQIICNLNENIGRIRHELGKVTILKSMPIIDFKLKNAFSEKTEEVATKPPSFEDLL
jgi:ribosome-binding factor A